MYTSVACLDALTEIPDKSNLRKEGFNLAHSSRVQSIMAGMSRWQELEAASHVESTVRKKRADECLCSAGFLLFMQSRT